MKKILIIFLAISSFQFAQLSSWDFHGNMKNPVAGGDIWQDLDNFYVFGGYSDSLQENVSWIQKYRVYYDVWKLFDDMSTPRFGLVTESYNNGAYFFGGVEDESNSISGIERWGSEFIDEVFLSYNINFNRIFSTGHIIEDNFYIIGGNPPQGTSSDSLPYIIKYNLIDTNVTFKIDSLYLAKDLPEQQMSEVIGDDIFIFGGVINGISQDIYKFNIVTNIYEKIQDVQLKEPRAGGRAVISSDPNQIFIIGGYNEALESLNSVEIFTVIGDQYSIEEGPPIIEARYNFISCFFNDYIYILGGFDRFNEERKVLKSIERLNTNTFTTKIDEEGFNNISNNFELFQNYPNPFNPNTIIKYTIPFIDNHGQVFIQLKVYDILGNEITTLINKPHTMGAYEIEFNASKYPSGIYYYQLKSNSFIQTKKMILLK